MPVSHLGLTVSHIPSSASFFLSALQPLGYRYIGYQGDSIGLGVESADFFLTQMPNGSRASPNHIAFLADSRAIVRECYTAALNAGGLPNGAPSYRNEDCTCFNAAVEDLDGNTIEFIYRQPHSSSNHDGAAPSEHDHATHSEIDDDTRTLRSRRSRATTELDYAPTTSKSVKNAEASTQNTPQKDSSISNTLIGTVIGAAAGAAIVYAMCKTEKENAKEESNYLASKRSLKFSPSIEEKRPPSPTAETIPASKSETKGRKSHRNFSTTESAFSSRRPSLHPGTRAIDVAAYDQDEIQEAFNRYTMQRPEPIRRQTYEAIEYLPLSRSSPDSRASINRASTMPTRVDVPNYYIEAPRSTHSSRHSHRSRRSSVGEHSKLHRHDSGVSVHSSRSHRERGSDSDRRSSASTIKASSRQVHVPYDAESSLSRSAPASRRAPSYYEPSAAAVPLPASVVSSSAYPESTKRRAPSYYDPAAVPLPASVVSSNHPESFHRHHHHHHYHQNHHEPSYYEPASVPLPASVASSAYPASMQRRASSQYESALEIPMPSSKATSYVSAAQIPLPTTASLPSDFGDPAWEEAGEESDGLGDTRTVVPEDSISCVGLPVASRRNDGAEKGSGRSSSGKKSSSGRSRQGSSHHSDASERTVRPAKNGGGSRHSAMTLPIRYKKEERRGRDDGKRSAASYA